MPLLLKGTFFLLFFQEGARCPVAAARPACLRLKPLLLPEAEEETCVLSGTPAQGFQMAAQRIRAANSSGLPRCKSEGTLIDLSEGFSETSFNDVKGEPHPPWRGGLGLPAPQTRGPCTQQAARLQPCTPSRGQP